MLSDQNQLSLLSGDEAVALAAIDAAVTLGTGYPGTPSTEILETFAASVQRCVVIEEGDPYLVEAARTAGIAVEGKPDAFRFGELSVSRVRRILTGDRTPEPRPVADRPRAIELLQAHSFVVKTTDVLAVEVPDRPGGLADVLAALDGVNIEYMYAFPYARGGGATLIFRFDNPDAAIARLKAAGINLVTSEALLRQ